MGASLLEKARRLYHKSEYQKLIGLLESQVFRYRKNPEYYLLLGISCTFLKDYGGGYSYLKRAENLSPRNTKVLLSLAVLHFLRENTKKAISYWLQVLEENPQNKQAQSGLRYLKEEKKISDPKIKSLLPRFHGKRIFKIWWTIPAVLVGVIAFVLWILTPVTEKREDNELFKLIEENGIRNELPQDQQLFTERQIREEFKKMEENFQKYRDNFVRVSINRIMASNANEVTKLRANAIGGLLAAMDFQNFSDNSEYAEVASAPHLYHEVYVRWKGRIANLNNDGEHNSFQFLVGYHTSQILEGIITVILPFHANLQDGDTLELVGKLDTTIFPFTLYATATRPIYLVEENSP